MYCIRDKAIKTNFNFYGIVIFKFLRGKLVNSEVASIMIMDLIPTYMIKKTIKKI